MPNNGGPESGRLQEPPTWTSHWATWAGQGDWEGPRVPHSALRDAQVLPPSMGGFADGDTRVAAWLVEVVRSVWLERKLSYPSVQWAPMSDS